MVFRSLLEDERKGCIQHDDVFDDCDNNTATPTNPGFPGICPITTPRAEKTTSTLMELVTGEAEVVFCRQLAGTGRTHNSSYLYEIHCTLIRTAFLDVTIQTVAPKCALTTPRLPGTLFTTSVTPRLVSPVRQYKP